MSIPAELALHGERSVWVNIACECTTSYNSLNIIITHAAAYFRSTYTFVINQ